MTNFNEQKEFRSHCESHVITADHPGFIGHFPGSPIFPAVSQIEMVASSLEKVLIRKVQVIQVKRAKFRSILRPETKVSLAITFLQADEISWILDDQEKVYSQGVIRFLSPN